MESRQPTDEKDGERKRPTFLERTNPNATWRSVLFKAILFSAVAAAVWGICLWLKPSFQPEWQAFIWWEVVAGIVGAVCEWQPVDD